MDINPILVAAIMELMEAAELVAITADFSGIDLGNLGSDDETLNRTAYAASQLITAFDNIEDELRQVEEAMGFFDNFMESLLGGTA